VDPARMRELLSRLSCPLCGGMRDDSLLVVIDSPATGHGSVRAQCVRCHLSWAFPLEDAPYPTEWTVEEKPVEGPISADEVIELHRLLRDFEGPLVDLIRRAG
jgi:hypothetical protein